jgi:hypothetical protein
MTSPLKVTLLCLTLIIGFILVWGLVYAVSFAPASAATNSEPGLTPTPLPNQPAQEESPDISFIDNPSAACVLPQSGTGNCYINWYYLYVDASPNYIITMTLDIDNQHRARFQGFFQDYMYVPSEMLSFRVSCGGPGASGDPNWGLNHSYTIQARDTANTKAANYGQVYCPADLVKIHLPLVRR